MISPTITGLYAALNAIFNIFLANNVSSSRRKHGIGIGTEQDELLLRARIHGNNAEFVPLAIVMMLIAELMGAAAMPLHIYGGMLFAARVMHAFGMPLKAPNPLRFGGTAITWTAIVAISGYVLFLHFTK